MAHLPPSPLSASGTSGTDGGTYLLIMTLDHDVRLRAGRLEETAFPPGSYVYVGRARRGLRARLLRHLGRPEKMHWHIDYLRKAAAVAEIWINPEADRECSTARRIAGEPGFSVPVPGFGASDCRCRTHLYHHPGSTADLHSLWSAIEFTRRH